MSKVAFCPLWIFQFTPLREGRQVSPCTFPAYTQFQFTPLREGRLKSKIEGAEE